MSVWYFKRDVVVHTHWGPGDRQRGWGTTFWHRTSSKRVPELSDMIVSRQLESTFGLAGSPSSKRTKYGSLSRAVVDASSLLLSSSWIWVEAVWNDALAESAMSSSRKIMARVDYSVLLRAWKLSDHAICITNSAPAWHKYSDTWLWAIGVGAGEFVRQSDKQNFESD